MVDKQYCGKKCPRKPKTAFKDKHPTLYEIGEIVVEDSFKIVVGLFHIPQVLLSLLVATSPVWAVGLCLGGVACWHWNPYLSVGGCLLSLWAYTILCRLSSLNI